MAELQHVELSKLTFCEASENYEELLQNFKRIEQNKLENFGNSIKFRLEEYCRDFLCKLLKTQCGYLIDLIEVIKNRDKKSLNKSEIVPEIAKV